MARERSHRRAISGRDERQSRDSAVFQGRRGGRGRHDLRSHRRSSEQESHRYSARSSNTMPQSLTLPATHTTTLPASTSNSLPSVSALSSYSTLPTVSSNPQTMTHQTADSATMQQYYDSDPALKTYSLPSIVDTRAHNSQFPNESISELAVVISANNASAPVLSTTLQHEHDAVPFRHQPHELNQRRDAIDGEDEINSYTQHEHEYEINLTLHNHNNSLNDCHAVTIPDAVSGYSITELPRTIDFPTNHHQILMMDECQVSRCNNTDTPDSNDQQQYYDQRPAMTNTAECLPQPFYYPPARRERRHRQRRSRRHRRRSRHRRHRQYNTSGTNRDDGYVKPSCCSVLGCKICLAACLQFKKVLVFFASFGVICVLIGIVLGVLRAPGNSFFTMSLMFVGLGLILLTMVLVGWKCTPADQEPCHMLFGLGSYCTLTRRHRRRRERLYWLGSRLHPEFRYRAPPPSYAAAMQEYRNDTRHMESIPYVPGSPPPSYKSHTTIQRPGIHIIFPRNEEFPDSNPPTYRLRAQVNRPSLAVLNDSIVTGIPEPANRFSISSTAGLVEAEQFREPQTPVGIVNMSFEGSDRNLELSEPVHSTSSQLHRASNHDDPLQSQGACHWTPQETMISIENCSEESSVI